MSSCLARAYQLLVTTSVRPADPFELCCLHESAGPAVLVEPSMPDSRCPRGKAVEKTDTVSWFPL